MANKTVVSEPKNNTTTIIAFVGIGILLLGAGVGFYFYNKSKKAKDAAKGTGEKTPLKDKGTNSGGQPSNTTTTKHTTSTSSVKQPVNSTPKQPTNISSYTPPSQQQKQQNNQSNGVPFTSVEEGNVFRTWVNRTYPSYAKAIKLDTTGDYNNSYIQAAWDKYGVEFSNAPAPNVPYATYIQPIPKIPIFPADDLTNAPPAPKPITLNPEINISMGFKNTTEGNKFRAWINDNYPAYAKSIQLDRTGSYNNSFVKKALAKYGNEYFNS